VTQRCPAVHLPAPFIILSYTKHNWIRSSYFRY